MGEFRPPSRIGLTVGGGSDLTTKFLDVDGEKLAYSIVLIFLAIPKINSNVFCFQ